MDSSVLREFLVKLGYKVDPASERRMREGVEKMSDMVMQMAKAAAVMATAVGVAVVKVADDLSDLHFASKRIGASAGNIRAFEFAIKQMGGSGEAARAALEGLARFMRNSPGAEDWLNANGVSTRDANGNLRDTVEIYKDLAGVLQGMESSQANVVAQKLGLDDNTLQAIRSGDLKGYMADYLATLEKLGIKQDEAAARAAELTRRFEELKTIMSLLVEKYAMKVVGFFDQATEKLSSLSKVIAETPFGSIWGSELDILAGHLKTVVDWLEKAWGYIKLISNSAWASWKDKVSNALGDTNAGGFIGMMAAKIAASFGSKDALAALQANGDIPGVIPVKPNGPISSGSAGLFSNLEKQYGLPAGLLDRMWNQESGRGKNMLSPKGAMGHFQFMPGTAKQYGVSDPNDLTQSATGAAKYLRDLMGMFGGDINRAVAAYNWGPGNVQRYGLGAAPSETRQYLKNVAPMSLQSSTTINVSGVSDPMSAAQAVANIQIQTFQDMTRNFQGAMQ